MGLYDADMVYADNFHRLVLIGTAFGDVWNTSLSIAHDSGGTVPEPDDGLIAALATAIASWYSNATGTGIRISSTHRLTGFKLNRIGPDGRYVDGETHEHIYTSPIPGGFSAAPPPQLATVLTLRTAVERGPAARGRMYLPPVDGYIAPDATTGQATVLNAQRVATAGAALVDAINDVYNGTFPVFSAMHVVVASNSGAGTFRRVTRTSAGRVPDVMRSRRSALNEAPEFADVPA